MRGASKANAIGRPRHDPSWPLQPFPLTPSAYMRPAAGPQGARGLTLACRWRPASLNAASGAAAARRCLPRHA